MPRLTTLSRVRLLPVLLIGLLLATASSSDVLRPGDPALDTQQVPLGRDTLAVLMPVQDSLRIVAVLTLHTRLQQHTDEPLLVRQERMVGLDRSLLQSD